MRLPEVLAALGLQTGRSLRNARAVKWPGGVWMLAMPHPAETGAAYRWIDALDRDWPALDDDAHVVCGRGRMLPWDPEP